MTSRRNRNFGRFVAEVRTAKHLSISKAAAHTGGLISRDWWSKIERGEADGDRRPETLDAIAKGLGIPVVSVVAAYDQSSSVRPSWPAPADPDAGALIRLMELRAQIDEAIARLKES